MAKQRNVASTNPLGCCWLFGRDKGKGLHRAFTRGTQEPEACGETTGNREQTIAAEYT